MCNGTRSLRRIRWPIEWLQRQADLFAHQERRHLLHPWHLDANTAPALRHAPHQAWHPRHTGFRQGDLHLRELCQDTFSQEAADLIGKALRLMDEVFNQIAVEAALRRGVAIGVACVDVERKSVTGCGLVDRPEIALAERLVVHDDSENLYEAMILCIGFDLGDRSFR